jgi:hypothetical protein
MAMTVADARSANHGAGRAANNRTNWTGDDRTGRSADCGAGHGSFSAARGVGCGGQGGERRKTRDDKKFAHRLLHNSIARRTREHRQSSPRQRTVQANGT